MSWCIIEDVSYPRINTAGAASGAPGANSPQFPATEWSEATATYVKTGSGWEPVVTTYAKSAFGWEVVTTTSVRTE
jgi:hypothetical protein